MIPQGRSPLAGDSARPQSSGGSHRPPAVSYLRISARVFTCCALVFLVVLPLAAQTPAPKNAPAEPTPDELFQLGQQLFDQFAPPEIKQQYEFPRKEQWDAFALRLQQALDGGSLDSLAAYEAEARAAAQASRGEINARNKMRAQAAERTAINAPMQGTAADIILLARRPVL